MVSHIYTKWPYIHFVYIWLTISSCYGSIPLTLGLIWRDGGLSTLCHSCGFACKQRMLKTFPVPGYIRSEDGIVWLWHLLVNLLHQCKCAYPHMLSWHIWPNHETVFSSCSRWNNKIYYLLWENSQSKSKQWQKSWPSTSLTVCYWIKSHLLKVAIKSMCLLRGRIPKQLIVVNIELSLLAIFTKN